MAAYTQSHTPVFKRFFEPVLSVYRNSRRQYACPELTDRDFLEMGIQRCLSDSETGRDFLQRHGDRGRRNLTVDLHFKALKSSRRLDNISSINPLIVPRMAEECEDPFASIAELDNFATRHPDIDLHATLGY